MNKDKHKLILIIAFLIAIVSVAIIFGAFLSPTTQNPIGLSVLPQTNQSNPEKVEVRLKWVHQAQFAGFYVAQEKGYYSKNNLDVQLNPGGVDFPAINMVAGGKEQFGVTSADQILFAREKGIPIVAIATIYRKNPMVLFSLKDLGIKQPSDLIGKKVGVAVNKEILYHMLLKKTGVDSGKVTEVPIKVDITPLLTGQVDAWIANIISEPITAQEKGFEVDIIWLSDYDVNFYGDVLFTTEDMIKNHPDIVRGFVNATLDGWNYAYDNPDEAVDYTMQYASASNSVHETKMMQASLQLIKPDDRHIGDMQQKEWENMQQQMLEAGAMKSPVDLGKTFTNQFVENYYNETSN
ncbi:MAG TPA: ABC transporter substrate-binding protein [archaeon]|nr:ABC transporter substrate-binding protein [archaeon]